MLGVECVLHAISPSRYCASYLYVYHWKHVYTCELCHAISTACHGGPLLMYSPGLCRLIVTVVKENVASHISCGLTESL